MSIPVYNPYKFSDAQFTDGLDYIAANLPGSPTFDDLVTTILAYFASLADPVGPDGLGVMQTLMPNSANDYINKKITRNLNFDAKGFASMWSVMDGLRSNTIDSYADFFDSAEEQLTMCNVNTITKTSLYTSLGLARASNGYWNNIVTTPGSWSPYLNGNVAINYANIPFWVTATYMSTFSGFAQVQAPQMGNADVWNTQGRLQSVQYAVCSALVVTAGKIIFKWAQRSKPQCNSNMNQNIRPIR